MNEVKKEIFRLRSVVEELQTEVNDLAFENKNFAEFLEEDYSQEGISNIANGGLAPQELIKDESTTEFHCPGCYELISDSSCDWNADSGYCESCTFVCGGGIDCSEEFIKPAEVCSDESGTYHPECFISGQQELLDNQSLYGIDDTDAKEIANDIEDAKQIIKNRKIEVFNSCVCQTLRYETCICGEVK